MTEPDDILKEIRADIERFRTSIRTTLRLQTMLMASAFFLSGVLVIAFAR